MNMTREQYARIEKYFPIQHGNVKIDNYTFINASQYIAEKGCKWRVHPEKTENGTAYSKNKKSQYDMFSTN